MSRLTSLVPRSALLLAVVASSGGLGSAALAGSTNVRGTTPPTAADHAATKAGLTVARVAAADQGARLGSQAGSFAVTVPSHSVAAPDGVPEDLPRGSHVRITALVWSTPGEEPGRAQLSVDGSVGACPTIDLKQGVAVRVACEAVAPAGPWVASVLLVDGRGRAVGVLRSWRHRG